MKMPRKNLDELIKGILPMLREAWEDSTKVERVKGRQLIAAGVKHVKGKGETILQLVDPNGDYLQSQAVKILVNHKRRLANIIDQAKDREEMQTQLALYLCKYAISKDAVCKDIPAHLLNKNKTESNGNDQTKSGKAEG